MHFRIAILCAVMVSALPMRVDAVTRSIGVDVSHWEGTVNWPTVKASGKDFAFTKATEGMTYTDDTFTANMVNGKNAGMLMGAYHFARPDNNTAIAEADRFAGVMAPYLNKNYLRPVLDLETGGGTFTKAQLSQWGNDFIHRFLNDTGVECLLYSGHNYSVNYVDSSLNGWDLWFANYPTTPDPQNGGPNLGTSFNHWEIWQYADDGTVPGISGAVDMNAAAGDVNYVKQFLVPEPGSLSLLAGVTALAGLRRRRARI
jgi:lysozyme